jgi:hypothetical protein
VAADLDADIDQLYQLPLSEFTPARNALAGRAGPRAAEIRKLQKPNTAAWAVNQLYGKQRRVYDKLLTAAERLRAAHAKRLAGEKADVTTAEAAHRVALDAAVASARAILEQAGDPLTPATMTALSETLDALPGPEPPGRLTRPLRPRGFEALTGLLAGGPASSRRSAEIRAFPVKPPAGESGKETDAARRKREAAEQAREEAARAKEIARLDAALRQARTTEREAQIAFTRATRALAAAEQEQARLTKALEAAGDEVLSLKRDVGRRQHESDQASIARVRIEEQIRNAK